MMSDNADWAYWDDQLDLTSAIDQGHSQTLQGALDTPVAVSSYEDYYPNESTTTLGTCEPNSQSQTYRDPSDALLNLQDRSKTQGSKSFLQQIYELRNAYALNERPTSFQICQIAAETGLQDIEVSIWFQTERDLRIEWRKLDPEVTENFEPSQRHNSKIPTFLERVHTLRESFRRNLMCTKSQLLLASDNLNLQEFEVSLWFDSERCIQLDLMISNIGVQQAPASTCYSVTDAHFQPNFDQTKCGFEEDKLQYFEKAQQEAMNMSPLTSTLGTRAISTRPDSDQTDDAPAAKRRKKCTVQGIFECLFTGCNSKTKDISRWRDHQSRKHFPRQIWICWMNKSDGSLCQHGPVLRADNFMTHLIKEHNQSRSNSLLDLIQSKSKSVTNLFHDRYGFCKVTLNSWDESMKHISDHLCCGINASEWDHCCSSSHILQEYVKKEIIDFPQPLSSAIPLYSGFSDLLDPVHGDPMSACPNKIVLNGIKETTQAHSIDKVSGIRNNSNLLTPSLKDCTPIESSIPLLNRSYPSTWCLIDKKISGLSMERNDLGPRRRAYRSRTLSEEERKRLAWVRKIGACIPCKIRKIKCSPNNVCNPCRGYTRYIHGTCIRIKLSDIELYTSEKFTEESWLKILLNGELTSSWGLSGTRQLKRRRGARLLASPFTPYKPFSWWYRLSSILFQSSLQFIPILTSQGLGIKTKLYPSFHNFLLNQEFLFKENSIIFEGKEFRIANITFKS